MEDRYVGSSRLRLRKVTGPAGEVERKLGKKYGKTTPRTESVTSLYLITADRGFDGAEIATCCARVWEQRSSAW